MARLDGRVKILAVSCFFFMSFLFCLPLFAWTGKVVGVSDGDTIRIMHGGVEEKIRIYGIDCPEGHQPFGSRAKQFTSACVFGKTVEVIPIDIDRYGRTVGLVNLDGSTLSAKLVQSGMAWVYDRYCSRSECAEWRTLQDQARAQRLGLWSGPEAIPPWVFRRTR